MQTSHWSYGDCSVPGTKTEKKKGGKGGGTFPVVQWLRLLAPKPPPGGLGSIPGQGIRSLLLQLKILDITTKTQKSQIN